MHMGVFNKRLSAIDFEAINDLVSSKLIENKYLDYKQDITHTLKNDETKINILKDIVSFANSQGGDIIIGVSEKDGIPNKITGIDITKVDEIKRTIESITSNGVNPRIPKYEFNNPIPLPDDQTKVILILRIYRSYNTPHMLVYKDENRFWYRGSAKNEMMDLQQIKASIDYSQGVEEKIKGFLMDRINIIESDEVPYPMKYPVKTVIHFIPISSFLDNKEQVNLKKISEERDGIYYGISDWSGANHQFNIDGLLRGTIRANNLYSSYVQYFKNGIIESVDNHFIYPREDNEYKGIIPIWKYEKELSEQIIPKFLDLLRRNEIITPIWIVITLLNVKGFKPMVYRNSLESYLDNDLLKKDVVRLPIIIIDEFEEKLFPKLKPVFDFLWNLAGYEKTECFDENGKFREK